MKITEYTILVRSSSGKYHAGLSPQATNCNSSGSRRQIGNRPATEAQYQAAPESAFCRKCFPLGKPVIAGDSKVIFECWMTDLEKLVGHGLDGDQERDGFSIDGCYDLFTSGFSLEAAASMVRREEAQATRHRMNVDHCSF